ncbi:MAG TPA: hypothetical protein ENN69_00290 [Spirochaetia bacterium]|nr:hypothetical protein [Spirochaetia bacterium]
MLRVTLTGEDCWTTGSTQGVYSSIASLRFDYRSGVTRSWMNNTAAGTYQIFGNIVYIRFKEPDEFNQFDRCGEHIDYGA